MAPKLLLITIIHALLWNFIFSLSENVELNKDGETSLSNLHDRVWYTTHIRDCLKNSPLVADHKNYETLSGSDRVDSFENLDLAKDLSKPLRHVKRHAILRCHNIPAQENNEPNKPVDPTTSEWQMKSTPVNEAYGELYDQMTIQKSKFANLKKIDLNSHKMVYQEPLHHTGPVIQKIDLIDKNSKPSQLQLSLQDKRNKIKSLISTPQHKLGEIIQDKLIDESIHNKLAQPSLTLPLPPKFIKYPVINPLIRPVEIPNTVDTAVLMTDNDNQSNPLKPSPHSPHIIPNNNFYQKAENKPFLSLPPIQFNKSKPVEISYDKRVPPIAYLPKPPQFIQIPIIKPIVPPIFVQKEVSILPVTERPQPNIGSSSQYPKTIKNGIAQSTFQPILNEKEVSFSLPHNKQQALIDFSSTQIKKTSNIETVNKPIAIIEKQVSIYFPHKKPQQFIGLSPPTKQLIKTSDKETSHKPTVIENEVLMSPPNEQKQPFVDLSQQAPQLVNIPDKEIFYPTTPASQTMVPANVPYEQKQSIISLPSIPQITETFYNESTPQSLPIENEVSMSTPYGQQQPIVNYLPPPPPPQFQQIKIQKEISIPLSYPKPKVDAPLKLIKTFNADLISQSQQKKKSLNDQQQPIVLPSPPPLTKTTTSDYIN